MCFQAPADDGLKLYKKIMSYRELFFVGLLHTPRIYGLVLSEAWCIGLFIWSISMRYWILVWLGLGSVFAADLKPQVLKTLEEPPEDAEHFLQAPASFDMDSDGSYYLVDWTARVLFKWDKDGKFDRIIGAPGGGPGEFGFMGAGGPQGYLGIVDDVLYIYDGGRRAVQVFDKNGTFQKSDGLQVQLGRTNAFYMAAGDSWIIDHSSFMKEIPALTVSLVDAKTQKESVIVERQDTSFERKSEGGRVNQVVIKGYSERLVTAFNKASNQLIVGYNGEASFTVYDQAGKVLKKVPVKRPRRDVEKEDKDEFNEQGWIKNNTFFSTAFPEQMPYYNSILPYGKNQYLVFEISPYYRRVAGMLINDKGDILGKFRFKCGENGGLLGAKGKVMRIRTDEEGYFSLEELTFNKAS